MTQKVQFSKGANVDIKKLLKKDRESDEIRVNEFTEDSAQEFRDRVLAEAEEDSQKPIVVYVDSYGGQVDALAVMIETMDEVPNPFITVAVGKAMSCGAMLLSHGDIRFCGKHSRVMIHEVSGGSDGNVHDINTHTEEMKRLNRYFMNMLAKNCGIKGGYDALRKMIKDQDGRENYMDAEQALKFGIVDAIGLPRVDTMTVYQVNLIPEKKRLDKTKPPKRKKPDTKR